MKRLINKLIRAGGYELVPLTRRDTLLGSLLNLKRLGIRPATVIDVGAAYGDFTRICRSVFSEASYVLIEPLEEYRPSLEAFAHSNPRVQLVQAAAGAREGEASIYVHPDLVGSSLFRESEGSDVDGVPRTVRTATIDAIVSAGELVGPFFLKADVQGAERDVISGAVRTLGVADLVLLEVSLLGFFDGAQQASETMAFMDALGFVPYDLFGLSHRPLDGALAQADVLFVSKESPLRHDRRYATPDQRRTLTERLKARR